MFQLLGMFSKVLGMFYEEYEPPLATPSSEIITESGAFLMTENNFDLITE